MYTFLSSSSCVRLSKDNLDTRFKERSYSDLNLLIAVPANICENHLRTHFYWKEIQELCNLFPNLVLILENLSQLHFDILANRISCLVCFLI